ncbi:aldo/keto reductase [Longispora sp. K20-0274]|uniref:aldo/keto reductase n=1 Tax=Longispora sp. K20-0274 TaxID=3088255 RepID=UPI00399C49C5
MIPGERVRLGRTDLTVTRLGLGLAPIGGLFTAVPDEQALATVDRAWEHGFRLFDTAPLYGYGRSEQLAGRALSPRPRDGYVLATKVGRLLVPGGGDTQEFWAGPSTGLAPRVDFSYAGVHDSLAASLDRLGLDRIDVLHVHDPDEHYDDAVSGAFRALAELRAAGTIGAVSVGMNQAPMLARFVREVGVDCVMLAGRYTLLDQSGLDELLPLCAERGVGVLAAGVYNSGLLADPRPGARYDYGPAAADLLDRALAIEAVCARHGVPLRAAALRFALGHPAVTSVVVGARSPAEVDDNAAMFATDIPGGLWRDLRTAGLLPDGVPTP